MTVFNDNGCGWLNNLPKRNKIKQLESNLLCDYLIIGAGYTGLSVARQLSQLNENKKIILVDAQIAGEGASSRNSGYLVDTTLNDGFTSNKDLENYKKKSDIYELGIEVIKKFIKEYQVNCDWNECGKYFASSKVEDKGILKNFSEILFKLGFEHNLLSNTDLTKKLGTSFYNIALYTKGGILLHPGKLVRSMIDTLPNNIQLFEKSSLLEGKKENDIIFCHFKNGIIKTKKIIIENTNSIEPEEQFRLLIRSLNINKSKYNLINDYIIRIDDEKKLELSKALDNMSKSKFQSGDYKGAIRALRRSENYY